MKICNPAKLYLGISILFLLIGFISKSISVYALLLKAFFVLLWVYVLSILCKKGMKELAWAFVLLPFVAMGSTLIYGGGVYREGIIKTVRDYENELLNSIPGSWKKSCLVPELNGNILTAICKNNGNILSDTTIDISKCINREVININGFLTCATSSVQKRRR